jgi:hypothetical protein
MMMVMVVMMMPAIAFSEYDYRASCQQSHQPDSAQRDQPLVGRRVHIRAFG